MREIPCPMGSRTRSGTQHPKAIPENVWAEIFAHYEGGRSLDSIASLYGVKRLCIWHHVDRMRTAHPEIFTRKAGSRGSAHAR